ncbi:hypothetical protein CLV30_12858 [Haloactinopolyspora alba]|uniref:Uncharacterized protein n=1 Tax=Haloactinopolyspora alba TaxID=648780 RepID=A0A2P8DF06_9ACTN|nr:hypothetical protein [Haloactinopolyspora alba]PSK95806.1 hypothetical protein CLV30_12858 [Haloactinopolyspora alba]
MTDSTPVPGRGTVVTDTASGQWGTVDSIQGDRAYVRGPGNAPLFLARLDNLKPGSPHPAKKVYVVEGRDHGGAAWQEIVTFDTREEAHDHRRQLTFGCSQHYRVRPRIISA